jgi:phosphoserine aminotransferase
MSVMEMSHRGKDFSIIAEELESDLYRSNALHWNNNK